MSVYFGYQVFDSDGTVVANVVWVDDTKQEMACYEWPYRIVGDEMATVIKQVNGVRVDFPSMTIHVNTGVAVTIPTWTHVPGIDKQPQACSECMQEPTCRRICYCAAYKCCFGEVSKP